MLPGLNISWLASDLQVVRASEVGFELLLSQA